MNVTCRKAKRDYFWNKFNENCLSSNLWSTFDSLTGRSKSHSCQITSFSTSDGRLTSDLSEISDLLYESFVPNKHLEAPHSIKTEVSALLTSTSMPLEEDSIVTEAEVLAAIAAVRNDASAPLGLIPMKIIKICRKEIAPHLSTLFSKIIKNGFIPDFLKLGIVIPLYKGKGPLSSCDSFRPITNLSPLAKVFESVLFSKLTPLIDPKLCNEQHGFRKGRSCHSALLKFSQEIWNSLDARKGCAGAVFIDFKKAFNSVNKELLLHKLAFKFNLPQHLVRLINNYLTNREFRIKIGNFKSRAFREINTVPQGSSLGPLLFAAFIDDIHEVIDIPFILYADDNTVFTAGSDPQAITEKLNTTLAKVDTWSRLNQISISSEKTKFMLFKKPRDNSDSTRIFNPVLNGHEISRTFCFKLLGLVFDQNMTFNAHFTSVKSKLASVIGKIRSIAKLITPKVFTTIFKSFVIPVFDYGIDIWATQTHLALAEAQAPINRLVAACLYPSLFRKLRRKIQNRCIIFRRHLYNNHRHLLRVSDVLVQLRVLTISERAEWTLLKNCFISLKTDPSSDLFSLSTNSRCSRSLPLLSVSSCNSECLRKSVKFRSIKAWNSLPKSWDFDSLSLSKFKMAVYDLLVARRSDQYFSF